MSDNQAFQNLAGNTSGGTCGQKSEIEHIQDEFTA